MNAPRKTPASPSDDVRILIVDDRPANLDALAAILRATGYSLTRAQSGPEALKMLLKHDFACCLMDIRMPGMDGFETARLIRDDAELRNLPIIFVTAEAGDQQEVFLGYEAGAVDFLIKPLEPSIVRSKVRVFGELYLQKRRLARSAEIEALNAELSAANDALNAANQDLEHFTHIAAHDLREPLRKQRNLVDLLADELNGTADRRARELLRHIGQTADTMLGMIDDFRALTKIEYDDLRREAVDMRRLAESCLDAHAERLAVRRPTVSFDPELGVARVYESLARILYDNLIKNALDHATRDGFELAFTREVDAGSGVVTYGVRNSASSIPPAECDQVFRMFRKAGDNRSRGSGVGLSICKRVVDRHTGQIRADSGDDFVHVTFTFGDGRGR